MILKTIKSKLKANATVPGLLKGSVEYTIQSATSDAQWEGPKISREVWNTILEFFWHTWQRTKSESQVRLYVNTKTNKWAAWAYPQERGTGMTTREVDNEEAKTQRAMFKESDGWIGCGTVHHHCDCSAFQSGTDHTNEKDQDGLHITIGHINRKQHDFHARFYFDGLEYQPDMSAFWDVGDEVRKLVPPDCLDRVARHQMTMPAPAGTTFPEQWKLNLIEPPKLAVVVDDRDFFPGRGVFHHGEGYHGAGSETARGVASNGASAGGGSGAGNGQYGLTTYTGYDMARMPEWKRKELALKGVYEECAKRGIKLKDVESCFKFFSRNPFIHALRNAAGHGRIMIWDIISEWEKDEDMEMARLELAKEQAKHSKK